MEIQSAGLVTGGLNQATKKLSVLESEACSPGLNSYWALPSFSPDTDMCTIPSQSNIVFVIPVSEWCFWIAQP